jgi:hypothetical protein
MDALGWRKWHAGYHQVSITGLLHVQIAAPVLQSASLLQK